VPGKPNSNYQFENDEANQATTSKESNLLTATILNQNQPLPIQDYNTNKSKFK